MDQQGRKTGWRSEWTEPALLAGVLVAIVVPRLSSLHLVYAGGELSQWDGDSAYHLKRILGAISHFPSLLRFDPAMNWPDGAFCPWPDGFDYLAAAWGLVAGLGDVRRATVAVLLFTPLLALLVAWAAMDLARLVIPDGPAKPAAVAAAAALTSVAPSSVALSTVGFLDHHIAEVLAALLLAGWALRRFRGPAASFAASPLRWELAGALVTTFSLWVFAGGALYVALACLVIAAAVLGDDRPRLIGSGVPALAAAAAASALLSIPAIRAHGRLLSYQLPSLLQPLLVGAGAAGLAVAVLVTRLARRRLARAALLACVGVALTLVAGLALTGAAHEVRAGLAGWLLRKDPWIATIAEFQPLGKIERRMLLALFFSFGAIGVGAPLILLGGTAVTVRSARGRGLAFAALTASFALLTLNQVRFGRVGVPLLMIHACALFAAFAHRRASSGRAWTVRVFPALAAIVLIWADPVLRPRPGKQFAGMPPVAAAARDLGVQAGGDASSGVLTSWDLGHVVSWASGLPTATNGFGPYLGEAAFREAEAAFHGTAEALDAYLVQRRLRFVVAGAMTESMLRAGDGRGPFVLAAGAKRAILDLEYMKEFGASPLVIGGSGIPGANVRHLEHLMPIVATRNRTPGLEFGLPAVWIYERVAGARLSGTARPGARVLATLDFREQGRPHVWRAFADAGADGRFELVVPLPSGLARPTLSTAPRYAVRAEGGAPVKLEVPERAVRAGEIVRIGALAAPASLTPRHAAPRRSGDEKCHLLRPAAVDGPGAHPGS